jgi:hypothetical protein
MTKRPKSGGFGEWLNRRIYGSTTFKTKWGKALYTLAGLSLIAFSIYVLMNDDSSASSSPASQNENIASVDDRGEKVLTCEDAQGTSEWFYSKPTDRQGVCLSIYVNGHKLPQSGCSPNRTEAEFMQMVESTKAASGGRCY